MPISMCANALWYKRWGADEVLFYQVPVCGVPLHPLRLSSHLLQVSEAASLESGPEAVSLAAQNYSLGTLRDLQPRDRIRDLQH